MKIIQDVIRDETGATAIEYGLIAGGVSLAIVGAVFFMGDELRAMFEILTPFLDQANGNVQ